METNFKQLHLNVMGEAGNLLLPHNFTKRNLHHRPLCSFKVEKKLFRIKNYEISGFCCCSLLLRLVAKGRNFYSNYDNAQRSRPSDEDSRGASCCRVYARKVFHLSADDGWVRCCFVLSDIIVVMGCLVIELKMLFLRWSVLLLNFPRDG